MLIDGVHHHSITYLPGEPGRTGAIRIIDQRFLPFKLEFLTLATLEDVIQAIGEMKVRGAPLIGITAAFGLLFALKECPEYGQANFMEQAARKLIDVRPTAYNTEYCLQRVLKGIDSHNGLRGKRRAALQIVLELMEEDKATCRKIGENGLALLKEISLQKGRVNILTHCNAGWLACVDYGTATSPIYLAKEIGLDLHVWVDETRPRNQGARITVWELTQNGIANSLITDNAGGHLMQNGLVDLVLVGCDRVTKEGFVANKIGTYLKALAARENNIPFYIALPSSTIDWRENALADTVIEERDESEVKFVEGWADNEIKSVLITDKDANAYNPGFDVTPAKFITGLITERGICRADREEIVKLFPEDTAGSSSP